MNNDPVFFFAYAKHKKQNKMKAEKELKEKISAQVNFRDNGVQEISLPLNNISQKKFLST